MQFSIREILVGVAAFSCVLVGYLYYGLLGASPIGLVFSIVLFNAGHRSQRKWMANVGLATAFLFLVTTVLTFVGWFFFDVGPYYDKAFYPFELKEMARIANADITDAKVAGLGSFIDAEHVWRLSLTSNEIDRIVTSYGLTAITADNVPPEFWRAFPLQWRPSHYMKNEYYTTPGFPAQSRGPDGEYYFMMYESQNKLLYVWHKSNF